MIIADTAGLRAARDAIEAEGVRRAQALAQDADLRLLVVDAAARDGALARGGGARSAGDLLVLNKCGPRPPAGGRERGRVGPRATAGAISAVSATDGGGLDELSDALAARVVDATSPARSSRP